MRFILGLVTGVAIGAAVVTASSGQSGKDIRRDIERIRRDIEKRDFDAAGARIEKRFNDLQSSLESKFAQAGDAAKDVADEAEAAVDEAAQAVSDAAEDGADEVAKA
jgi:gas vesicle protein